MALPNRDAERLDHALDAQLQGREESLNDSHAGLLTTFGSLQAMNEQVATDTKLRNDLWRSMMSTIPLSLPGHLPVPSRSSVTGSHAIPFIVKADRRVHRRTILQSMLVIALLFVLMVGAIGYRQFGAGDSGPSIPAPMAAQMSYQGPNIGNCETQPRSPGSVADLAGQVPSESSAFPRYNDDPLQSIDSPDFSSTIMDPNTLLAQTDPVEAVDPAIDDLLRQLYNCSPYLLKNSSAFDLDGRYFALFSDDYFRREFAGYKAIGKDLRLARTWTPNGYVPKVLDVRSLGDRILLILDGPHASRSGNYPVLLLAHATDGWRVDEVGNVATTGDWNPATPVSATPQASPVSGLNYDGPLAVTYVLFDVATAGTPPALLANYSSICDQIPGGEDIDCGWLTNRLGPWWYNEYPANTDFTFLISNVSSENRRFEVGTLGISIEIAGNSTVPVVINAAPGEYLFTIYPGSSTKPLVGGVLYFNAPGQRYSQG